MAVIIFREQGIENSSGIKSPGCSSGYLPEAQQLLLRINIIFDISAGGVVEALFGRMVYSTSNNLGELTGMPGRYETTKPLRGTKLIEFLTRNYSTVGD